MKDLKRGAPRKRRTLQRSASLARWLVEHGKKRLLLIDDKTVTVDSTFNGNTKAKSYIVRAGIVTQGESAMAGSVLNAAFLTYVASAVNSLLILIYYLLRARSMDR